MTILITGTAGFIGYHLVKFLTKEEPNLQIVGLDSINDYYNPQLKYDRLAQTGILKKNINENKLTQSSIHPEYSFIKLNLEDNTGLKKLFQTTKFDLICHLAAQAGVRYSISHPEAYINSNLVGFANLIEQAKLHQIKHFIYASSSSVYGLNQKTPFSESDRTDNQASLYGATKKSNELIAHTYSYNFNLSTTGLRFFTVYGPWGRPDMAYSSFTQKILNNQTISIYNLGNCMRDFTYVEDIVKGLSQVIKSPPGGRLTPPNQSPSRQLSPVSVPAYVFNIGNSSPVKLMDFVNILEQELGTESKKEFLPMQSGDVVDTYADMTKFQATFNYHPKTTLKEGLHKFYQWYQEYYKTEKS